MFRMCLGALCRVASGSSGVCARLQLWFQRCVLLLKTNTLTIEDRDTLCPSYSPTPAFTLSPPFLTDCSAYTAIPPALPFLRLLCLPSHQDTVILSHSNLHHLMISSFLSILSAFWYLHTGTAAIRPATTLTPVFFL